VNQATKPSTPSFAFFTVHRDIVNVERENDRYRSNRLWSSNVKLMVSFRIVLIATVQELEKEVHEAPEKETDIAQGVEARRCGTSLV
jgi:hypothetical protein